MNAAPLGVLGCRVDALGSAEALAQIEQALADGHAAHVVTLGAEMAVLAVRDTRYRQVINGADLVLPDTIGIVLAARLLGTPVRERVTGIDLAAQLCQRCAERGYGVFFLGGRPGIAERAAAALQKRFPGLSAAGARDGYFDAADDALVADTIRRSGARLVLVGLGFPKQEYWIQRHIGALEPAVCIGVGGTFDVWAGEAKRAPAAIRACGLEWLYRLMREPRRFRRQLALPVFAAAVMREAFVQRRAGATTPLGRSERPSKG